MKTTMKPDHVSTAVLTIGALVAILTISACAPDPQLQKQMDQDILTAAESRETGETTGPQQGRGSRTWGYGGF